MAKKTSLLVVGVGSIGERHVRCFQATGRADVAVCDINAALLEEVAARYSVAQAYSSLDDALAQRFDAAVICAPAHLHTPFAQQLADHGVHLLIEKPLAVETAGLAELHRTIQARKLSAAVAYVTRAHPALAAMKAALDDGQFGPPVQIVATCGQHFPTYRPAYRDIYYAAHATGGGAVQDALTHVLNAGQWLVGPAERVAADVAHQVLPGVDVEDTAHVLARHGNVLGSYTLNQHQAPNESSLTVVCERGAARFESHNKRWRWMTEPNQPWQDETFPELERDTLFVRQAHTFLDVLEKGAPPLCDFSAGLTTLLTARAILQAAKEQRWVEVQTAEEVLH